MTAAATRPDKQQNAEWLSLAPGAPLLRLPAETGNILRIEGAVAAHCPPGALGEQELMRLRLLIDEIFSNICRHAYAGSSGQMAVHVEPFDSRQKLLHFWAVDWGAPFDPVAAIPAAPPLSPDRDLLRQAPENLGLYLVSRSCHALEYKRAALAGDERKANLLRVSLALN